MKLIFAVFFAVILTLVLNNPHKQVDTNDGHISNNGNVEETLTPDLEELQVQANRGDPDAQFQLALAYDFGRGIKANSQKAIYWYEKSSEAGSEKASFYLGWLYQGGRSDVPVNTFLANAWFEEAALLGSTDAMNMLGKYAIGKRDYIQAYKWLSLAQRNGDSTLPDKLAGLPFIGQMAAEEIKEANRQADQWQKNYQRKIGD